MNMIFYLVAFRTVYLSYNNIKLKIKICFKPFIYEITYILIQIEYNNYISIYKIS
jgi:hypothetical protein